MDFWSVLAEVLILLTAALLFGMVFERFRQSAILGYLLAGSLLGPHVLNWIYSEDLVRGMADVGVSLLLFAIGLEFSLRRLVRVGPIGLGGGTLQILVTGVATAGLGYAITSDGRQAVALGAIIALSSTACVLRVLTDRAQIDSVFGRNALGILLLQDAAVVPLVLLVTMLGGESTADQIVLGLGRAALLIVGMSVAFYLTSNYLLPRLLRNPAMMRNRELGTLLAVVLALGSAWAAHWLKLSPALGAFIAGALLGESPFAMQVRADVGALRTLFMTLFFTSVGMLGDPRWMMDHLALVGGVVGLVLIGKAAVVTMAALLFKHRLRYAVATGVCLGQVGEFSFVIAEVAADGGVIDDFMFRLLVSTTLVTLFLTPYLIAAAPRIGRWFERTVGAGQDKAAEADIPGPPESKRGEHVVVIGFGPAGRRAAQILRRRRTPTVVVDLARNNVALAESMGFSAQLGDGTSPELLEHVNVARARAVVITLPDHRTVLQVVHNIKALAPRVPIIARARYHRFAGEIERAGVHLVVDEEDSIGKRLGREIKRCLRERSEKG